MPDIPTVPRLIPTGVPGLDEVLRGGFQEHGFLLVQGGPGSGKTTLALQSILARAAAGERCMYISLTETRRDLQLTCLAHGWTFDPVILCDLTRSDANLAREPETSVFHPGDVELGEVMRTVTDEIDRIEPTHVVFDGVSELRLLAGDALRHRRQLLLLKEFLAERKITAVLLDDLAGQFGEIPAESLVGGNILLDSQVPLYGRSRRRLLVTKYRGQPFREGYHDYEIVKGGVVVHPRLEVGPSRGGSSTASLSTGVVELDAMLGGGATAGSTLLFLGPAGVGKSSVAMQMVVAALQRGQKAAVFAFDEVESMVIDRSEKLFLKKTGGLRAFIESGQLLLRQVDPVEISPGSFAAAVRQAVDDGAQVVLIDSINGYLNSMPEDRFLATHLHELFAYLNQRGVVTLSVIAQHGMMMGMGGPGSGNIDVSYLADTVLLFRYFEASGAIHRAVSVIKKRTGSHERTLRALHIDEDGLHIGEPLAQFHGVMTGVPDYRGALDMRPPPGGGSG